MDDNEIVKLFHARNELAISKIREKYGRYCTSVAMNILKNREDAEECVNEALMKVWESIPPEQPQNLAGFLAQITKNICINRYNMEHAAKRGSGEIALVFEELAECIPSGHSVEKSFEQKELVAAVNAFITALPQAKHDLFMLRYWYCLSVSEAAERVGLSANNAAVTLARLRKKLLAHLKKRGYHE